MNKNIKLIFINEKMDAEDKLYALAHELGHIRCGHLKNGVHQTSVQEEVAANEFAHYLLHPPVSYKLKKWSSVHKSPIIVSLVIIMIAVIAMVIIHQVTLENSYYGEYYVTASGERYHEKDCITIKDKDNVRRLTQEDIDSGKYTPCQICLPE